MKKQGPLVLVLLALALLTGCSGFVSGPIGPVQTDRETVELGGADTVQVDISMGAGELEVSGGAEALMEATFTYNVTEWKPEVNYNVSRGEGTLTVRQPSGPNIPVGDIRYEWDLRLSDDVPIDMRVSLGAGVSNLDLGELNLADLELEMGAGSAMLDLAGNWEDDLFASIRGGVGRLVIVLPRTAGVRVEVNGGIGGVDAGGLNQDGNVYTNDDYGTNPVAVEVTIQAGVGGIELRQGE